MIKSNQLADPTLIQQVRAAYLRTLTAPMDGMWESSVIAHATFWEIRDGELPAGYYCIDSNNYLLRFQPLENYWVHAQEIFAWIISTHNVQNAIASTIEPQYFSLCLDFQKSITPHTYLFHDHQPKNLASDLGNKIFRPAEKSELPDLVRFYHANTEGSGEWIDEFLHKRLNRQELFVFYDQHTLIATGECIPNQQQTPYADLGMVVAHSFRGRGLGSSMLIQLKQHCYEAGWQPICSCAADNLASKKAIEKAGFISEHRMVNILFSAEK